MKPIYPIVLEPPRIPSVTRRIMRKYKSCLHILHLGVFLSILAPQFVRAQSEPLSSLTGARTPCVNKMASAHACNNIDLYARVSLSDLGVTFLNDVWGWIDPNTNREYALVGTSGSVVFVDVTNPVNPIHVGQLPTHDPYADNSVWRDIKVYKDHMYVTVDVYGDQGLQVFDLRQLREYAGSSINFTETAHYDGFVVAHNLAINEETGFAYITGYRLSGVSGQNPGDNCGGEGLHIVNIQNPANPTYAGCFADFETGHNKDGYSHDAQCIVYRGPDVKYQGREICIGSNETHISIVDVTDKQNPVKLGAANYPNVHYAHQGWLTADQRYFFMNDELDENSHSIINRTRTIIWDLSDLEDPLYNSSFYFPTTSIDHNLYIHGNFMFAANYTTGLRIVDIKDIKNPKEIAYFDTHPDNDETGFGGAWSSFRFPDSGTTIVTSQPDGLLILDPLSVTVTDIDDFNTVPDGFSLSPAYPNPFNPVTSTTLTLPEQAEVRAVVSDILGRSVAVIHEGVLPAGEHLLTFDAERLPTGSYYIQVQTDRYTTGIRVMLIK